MESLEGARNTAVDESDRGITDSHKLFPLSLPSSSRSHESQVAFTNFQKRNFNFSPSSSSFCSDDPLFSSRSSLSFPFSRSMERIMKSSGITEITTDSLSLDRY